MPVPMAMMPMAMMPVAMMPVAMMPVMMMPAHLGGELLGTLLNWCGNARIDQRYRVCALNWCRQHQKCANGHQTQNFRSVHLNLLRIFSDTRLRFTADLRLAAMNSRVKSG
jgi:hypothetical protein